jgi:hypothetical protein
MATPAARFVARWVEWLKWMAKSRSVQLERETAAVQEHLPKEVRARLASTRRALRTWGRARTIIIVALYFGLIATTVSAFMQFLPDSREAVLMLQRIARWTGTFSGVLAVAYLVTLRTLAKLEVEALLILILHVEDRTWKPSTKARAAQK